VQEPILIADRHDPRIADYLDVRERDLVGRDGRFIAEGAVVLRSLLASRLCRPCSILVDERRLAALSPLLERAPADVPLYVAPQLVIDEIAGFHLHRGILAVGERTTTLSADAFLSQMPAKALVLVLAGLGNHDNMGGAFRNAAAFAADGVLIDERCCDPFYRKAIRVSVGASLTTPWVRGGSAGALVDLLRGAGFEVLSLSPSGQTTLGDIRPVGRTAVLLGAEGPGLPGSVLAVTRSIRIPMAARFDSLNVATTSGIVLHHLRSKLD